MTEIKNPNFSDASYMIKGHRESSLTGLAVFGMLLLGIAMLIIFIDEGHRISSSFKMIMWIIFSVLTPLFIVLFIIGIIQNRKTKERICLAFFSRSMILYSANIGHKRYYDVDYTLVEEYGFIPMLRKQASRPYLLCDLLNYGKCKIILENGKKFTIPIADIKSARDKMSEVFPVKETKYVRVKGIDY